MKKKFWLALVLALALLFACAVAEAQAPKSISLQETVSILGMGKYNNAGNNRTPLVVTAKPAGAEFALFSVVSSRPEVVEAVFEQGAWYLRANKPGSACITAVTDNGKAARLTVQVKDMIPVRGIKAAKSKIALKSGDAFVTFDYTVSPSTADAIGADASGKVYQMPVRFESSNEEIVLVDNGGALFAGPKTGTATITMYATDASKAKGIFKVTVKPVAVESVALNHSAVKLTVGSDPLALAAQFTPQNATNQKVTWKSGNTKVATVDADGRVTGIAPGTATISCVSHSGKKKATCTVTVGYGFEDTVYRVYAIGNQDYGPDDQLSGTLEDMRRVAAAFENASFGGQKPSIRTYPNQTGAQIVAVLDEMILSSADENDVSVFYYSGHGASAANQAMRGALFGVDRIVVPVEQVRKKLDQVPGTVVVILDSCLSGQYIQSKGALPGNYNQQVVSVFQQSRASNYVVPKALTDSPVKSKYKILTAASSMNTSTGFSELIDEEGNRFDAGLFTLFLSKGIGVNPATYQRAELAADGNGDRVITLTEAFAYVDEGIKAFNKAMMTDFQQTQVWPKGDQVAIFARN